LLDARATALTLLTLTRPDLALLTLTSPTHPAPPRPTPNQYDSVHGRYEGTVEHSEDAITIDGSKIAVYSQM
jgi:glyceraldehyde 3-phosphate dehydrogenase